MGAEEGKEKAHIPWRGRNTTGALMLCLGVLGTHTWPQRPPEGHQWLVHRIIGVSDAERVLWALFLSRCVVCGLTTPHMGVVREQMGKELAETTFLVSVQGLLRRYLGVPG